MGSRMALPLTVSGDQGCSGSEIKQSPVGTGDGGRIERWKEALFSWASHKLEV